MTPEELRSFIVFLSDRVSLVKKREIAFTLPSTEEMIKAGFDSDSVNRVAASPWWQEMAEEVVETPEFCEEDDTSEQVLSYAKDVVKEYIRKRF